jgi:hypothetical protein
MASGCLPTGMVYTAMFFLRNPVKWKQHQILLKAQTVMEALSANVERLDQKVQTEENAINALFAQAKGAKKAGDIRAAKEYLKKRKVKQMAISIVQTQHSKLSLIVNKVENGILSMQLQESLKGAAGVLRDMNATEALGDLQSILDNVDDSIVDLDEINSAFENPFGAETGIDEEELMNELDEVLAEEELTEKFAGLTQNPPPKGVPAAREETEVPVATGWQPMETNAIPKTKKEEANDWDIEEDSDSKKRPDNAPVLAEALGAGGEPLQADDQL